MLGAGALSLLASPAIAQSLLRLKMVLNWRYQGPQGWFFLADDRGFAVVTEALAQMVAGADLIAGIDARGFLLGGAVAHRLGVGVLAIRKGGKLPPPVHSCSYDLEYGTATLEIPADGVALAGRRVAIVDDVLATGGTVAAARELLDTVGAQITMAAVVMELVALGGRMRLDPLPVRSLQLI
jgi:adenine phosphoribosyltransferase